MNILITNDDGVHAVGILALAQRLRREHTVYVVAPEVEQSGSGHSITLSRPLLANRVTYSEYEGITAYGVSGTPADCVILGLDSLVPVPIDLVISGINRGANIGTSVAYSGTVNAALEGCICGYPSIAVSQMLDYTSSADVVEGYIKNAAEGIAQLISQMDTTQLQGYILNINFPAAPAEEIKGMRVCEQGINDYDNVYKKEIDPFGREIYWIIAKDNDTTYNQERQTDIKWIAENYVTVTPLTWNHTYGAAIDDAKCKIEHLKLHF